MTDAALSVKIADSPSRIDGMQQEEEEALRKSGVKFIVELGVRLKLSQEAVASAAVFFHRFFLLRRLAHSSSQSASLVV